MQDDAMIERLRELLEKATKGPWYVCDGSLDNDRWYEGRTIGGGDGTRIGDLTLYRTKEGNAVNGALIVEAVNALPALLDRLSTLSRDREGWQPIETAPKDGSAMLGAFWAADLAEPRWLIDRIWWDDEFENTGWDDETGPTYRGAWTGGRVASWGHEEYAEEHPTHWQPLPAPPALKETPDGP